MSISDFEIAQITSTEDDQNLLRVEYNLSLAIQELRQALVYLMNADKCAISETRKAISQNHCGSLVSECWHSLMMARNIFTNGRLAIPAIRNKKLTKEFHAYWGYQEPRHARASTSSSRKRAKPARTGKKSKARSRLVSRGASSRKQSRPKSG